MLNNFHVVNYKCLQDVTVPLTPIHVLIGQNDAGKSSLMEALYAFFRTRDYTLADAFSGHWLGDDLVYENAAEQHVTLEGSWESFGAYGVQVAFAKAANRMCSKVDEWHHRSSAERKSVGPRNAHQTVIHQMRHETGLSNSEHAAEQEVAKLLDGAHLYRLDPRLMAIPSELSPKRKFRLDPDGFGLGVCWTTSSATTLSNLPRFATNSGGLFPQFRNVRRGKPSRRFDASFKKRAGTTQEKSSAREFISKRKQARVFAQQASDGAILFLGFLGLANLPHPPRLLLIEEPETGIYPERLGQVIELLRQMTKAAGAAAPQIVFTTHSPYVLSFFQPEEVTFMSRDNGIVRARPLRDAPHIQKRLEGFYLGELWYNLSEEELFADV